MAKDIPPTWAKIFVGEALKYPDYAFAGAPTRGMAFHIASDAEVFEIESVEPDPDFPGRFIVHAQRMG